MILNEFISDYIQVGREKMHYLAQGKGDPVLFIHGVPTSSLVWRRVIPHLSPYARCIAVDLIGMGKSDKPRIDYTVQQHIDYIERFINALDLNNITLVLHSWGSVIGFGYLAKHPEKVKAVAFTEAYLGHSAEELTLPLADLAQGLADQPLIEGDVEQLQQILMQLLPAPNFHDLSPEVMAAYQEPFSIIADFNPLLQYLREIPIGQEDTEVTALMKHYSEFLQKSNIPKLLLYGVPGLIAPMSMVSWAKEHLPNITLTDIGETLHYPQESSPENFSKALVHWYRSI